MGQAALVSWAGNGMMSAEIRENPDYKGGYINLGRHMQ